MSYRHYSVKESDIQKFNARLLSISLSKDEEDWPSFPHSHYFTELFYVVGGEGAFILGEKSCPITKGDLIIVPPYLEHTERSVGENTLEYYVIGIDGISFQEEASLEENLVFCQFSDESLISEILSQMLYEAKTDGYGANVICQHLLEVLLLRIIRYRQVIPVSLSTIRMSKECVRIKDYLDANYAEHITLDTLMTLTHMSKYYLIHSFVKYTGYSPIQYLNKRRMDAACTLLTDTDLPISAVSSAAGFSSQSYFTQSFQKNYGLSPLKYRQKHTSRP